jgi:hypothetical protein
MVKAKGARMATAMNESIAPSHLIHIFDQPMITPDATCELCKEHPAAFHWTKRQDGKVQETHEVLVCRVCAGMILLIGQDHLVDLLPKA